MTIEKPVVFFSHSSQDKVPLKRLKERFVELTGASIDVFLSSDGQSIRLGRNWVASIENGLQAAKIMFVFVSPNSIRSPWLLFETGHAYSKGIAVIPIGLFGIDIGQLSPPMNLLQGFNIVGGDSLNNIIVTVNETFGFRHSPGFTKDDFDALAIDGVALGAIKLLGDHIAVIKQVNFQVPYDGKHQDGLLEALRPLHGFMRTPAGIVVSGAKVSFESAIESGSAKPLIAAELDPMTVADVLAPLENGFRTLRNQVEGEPCGYECNVMFEEQIKYEWEPYRQLARLGTTVGLAEGREPSDHHVWLRWKSLDFMFGSSWSSEPSYVFLNLRSRAPTFGETSMGDLIDLLFERGVLKYRDY